MSQTLLQLRTKVRTDLELVDEPGISDSEIDSYIREGVLVAESNIHTLYEDYFLTQDELTLVSGTADYTLPTNIFANKLRAVVYRDGSTSYKVVRLHGKDLFERIEQATFYGQPSDLYYYLINDSTTGVVKMRFIPTPNSSGTGVIKRYFIRNAKELLLDADVCDIPKFESFIIAYAKNEIAINKPGLADASVTQPKVEALFNQMVDTLTNRTPDENDNIVMDMSFYEEMS